MLTAFSESGTQNWIVTTKDMDEFNKMPFKSDHHQSKVNPINTDLMNLKANIAQKTDFNETAKLHSSYKESYERLSVTNFTTTLNEISGI